MHRPPRLAHPTPTTGTRRRGFTIRDLAVLLACLTVAAGLVTSLAGANRDLSQATVCAANLHTLFNGLEAYVLTYNSYPPHNPYPGYVPAGETSPAQGFDPNLGWILTYGMGLTPPATYSNGHFKWHGIDSIDDLPDVVVCPAANLATLLPPSPEIEANALESTVSKYALFYQTSGNCRAATTVVRPPSLGRIGEGGRNPTIPDPSMGGFSAHLVDNAWLGMPAVWLSQKTGDPTDPSQFDNEFSCWVQAVHPSEIDSPGRVYYLADSRDYRPTSGTWPSAGTNDGWSSGYGNKVYLGTRHYEYANVMYLDGHVTRDNQMHDPRWNMDYDAGTGQARSSQWRSSTFVDDINLAMIHTQHHIMPQLNVKGWEYFFNNDGVAPR